MSAAVALRPLTADLRPAVLALGLGPGQERFSGAPAATVPTGDAHGSREHVVIVEGETPVGYFQLDRHSVPGAPAGRDVLGLRALLVDHAAQGRGVGRAAMLALPAYVRKRFPACRRVTLTVNLGNPAAIRIYRDAGFADTGEIFRHRTAGPQHVMLLELGDAPG
ncbi:GNAT family N-acetyltransferase [Baekduia soli]|uniref:GNAT family N-acetyltransferase n=1 Tax=Baekduia soli TaxID=496014 RepID=A0A5B8UBS4_9ACTN|nr:GNAT family N-acetyltransferase [Baekduia soli]QEC50268.1 GNAT family N-acetyltransferase [Baekduia soli]